MQIEEEKIILERENKIASQVILSLSQDLNENAITMRSRNKFGMTGEERIVDDFCLFNQSLYKINQSNLDYFFQSHLFSNPCANSLIAFLAQ